MTASHVFAVRRRVFQLRGPASVVIDGPWGLGFFGGGFGFGFGFGFEDVEADFGDLVALAF